MMMQRKTEQLSNSNVKRNNGDVSNNRSNSNIINGDISYNSYDRSNSNIMSNNDISNNRSNSNRVTS